MISRFLKEKCNILFAKESILIWSVIKYIVCSDKIICWFKDRSATTFWNNWSQEEAQRTLSKEMTTALRKSPANSEICIFNNKRRWFCMLCTCGFQFIFVHFQAVHWLINDLKWPVFIVLRGRRDHLTTSFSFLFPPANL